VNREWRDFPKEKRAQIDFQGTAELLPKIMQRPGLREASARTEVIDAWSNIVAIYRATPRRRVARRRSLCRVLQPGAAL